MVAPNVKTQEINQSYRVASAAGSAADGDKGQVRL